MQKNSAGYSLMLEVLLGLTIVSLSVLSLLILFPSAERSVTEADVASQANHLARQRLENLLAQGYASLPVGVQQGSVTESNTLRRGARPATLFRYREEITQPDPSRDIKMIRVYVTWSGGDPGDSSQPRVCLVTSKGRFW